LFSSLVWDYTKIAILTTINGKLCPQYGLSSDNIKLPGVDKIMGLILVAFALRQAAAGGGQDPATQVVATISQASTSSKLRESHCGTDGFYLTEAEEVESLLEGDEALLHKNLFRSEAAAVMVRLFRRKHPDDGGRK
jgi:hypothetical protein